MKATTIIIAAVLSLQFSALSADNPEGRTITENTAVNVNLINLAPVTPAEADFSDAAPEPEVKISGIAPVTPAEADFNDNAPELVENMTNLAPNTPEIANFEEIAAERTNTGSLAPVTPGEADFE